MSGTATSRHVQVSVVVESKNEAHFADRIPIIETLRAQTFPLQQVELIVAGDDRAVQRLREASAGLGLGGFKGVKVEDGTYHGLKDAGARAASGEIVVFLDWDIVAHPRWIETAVEAIYGGADALSGMAIFRGWGPLGPFHPIVLAASSISWERDSLESNNAAYRADLYRQHPYRVEDGRRAWIAQHEALVRSGAKLRREPRSLVYHYFKLRWWLFDLNVRAGVDMILDRPRLLAAGPLTRRQRLIVRAGVLAPLITMAAGLVRGVPRWFRYTGALGVSRLRQVGSVPIVIVMLLAAYACQAAGMYAAMIAPERMRRFSDAR